MCKISDSDEKLSITIDSEGYSEYKAYMYMYTLAFSLLRYAPLEAERLRGLVLDLESASVSDSAAAEHEAVLVPTATAGRDTATGTGGARAGAGGSTSTVLGGAKSSLCVEPAIVGALIVGTE